MAHRSAPQTPKKNSSTTVEIVAEFSALYDIDRLAAHVFSLALFCLYFLIERTFRLHSVLSAYPLHKTTEVAGNKVQHVNTVIK